MGGIRRRRVVIDRSREGMRRRTIGHEPDQGRGQLSFTTMTIVQRRKVTEKSVKAAIEGSPGGRPDVGLDGSADDNDAGEATARQTIAISPVSVVTRQPEKRFVQPSTVRFGASSRWWSCSPGRRTSRLPRKPSGSSPVAAATAPLSCGTVGSPERSRRAGSGEHPLQHRRENRGERAEGSPRPKGKHPDDGAVWDQKQGVPRDRRRFRAPHRSAVLQT
jgi:hypothetical protein